MRTRDARGIHVACATAHSPAARHRDDGDHGRILRRRGLLGRVVGARAVAAEGARITPVRGRQEKSRSRTGKGQRMRVHAGILRRAGGDSGAPLAVGRRSESRPIRACAVLHGRRGAPATCIASLIGRGCRANICTARMPQRSICGARNRSCGAFSCSVGTAHRVSARLFQAMRLPLQDVHRCGRLPARPQRHPNAMVEAA